MYRDIHTLQPYIIDFTQRGCHTLRFKTHILCWVSFSRNRAVCEIMWKNMVQPDRPETTIRRMRIACCIPKATNTHSDHAILNGFPLEKLLQKCASMLRPTYIASLFFFFFFFTMVRFCNIEFYCIFYWAVVQISITFQFLLCAFAGQYYSLHATSVSKCVLS